ncbi:MAG TPA: hypothetical protein VFE61_25355 [Candidatus Sulfotelmatobacter sp.]|jgi:hypothetical protein|nr:hypothetical protein [Candidatus Sulfotelmatobacter sp.]
MSGNHKSNEENQVRVELKYCEHCGGLWVREGGGGVYCEKCQPKVADLPAPKKPSARVTLPVHPPTVLGDYAFEIEDEDEMDFEAAGGVA